MTTVFDSPALCYHCSMRIQELWTLLPDYEPNPPLTHMPPQPRNRFSKDVAFAGEVGDGSMRWCACRVFQVYLGSGKFGDLYKPGETISPEPLWNCDALTRGYFHKNHHKVTLNYLSKAKGYGYHCCLTIDQTPRDPFEVAVMFGLTVRQADVTMYENTKAAVARRGRFKQKLREHREAGNPQSAVSSQAESIARML